MGSFVKAIWKGFNDDKAMRLAAAIAFSAIFSLVPLMVVLIAVAGWFLGIQNGGHGHHVAEEALLDQVRRGAGNATADTVSQLVAAAFNKPRQNLIAQIVGWAAFLAGATALFSSLQDSLNSIWGIEAVKGGWKLVLRSRLTSFAMILVAGLLLLATLGANAGIAFVGKHFAAQVPFGSHPATLAAAAQVVTFLTAWLAFSAMYRVLPDVRIAWRDVWLGGAVTAALFAIGEIAIAFYLAVAGVASAYGAAGSILVALLWIYYSAIVFLLGAEFTKVAARCAATTAPAIVRHFRELPPGTDPRNADSANANAPPTATRRADLPVRPADEDDGDVEHQHA